MLETKVRFRGNPHHLALLIDAEEKGKIAIWNAYFRKNGSAFHPRLAGADLSGLSLGEIILDRADLTDADFTGTNLSRASLNHARMRGARLNGANLSGARMNHSDLTNADLRKARMTNVRARGAIFKGANFSETMLDGAELTTTAVKNTPFSGGSRSNARLKVRVKVKAVPESVSSSGPKPWIKALNDEAELKEHRHNMEEKRAEAEKETLNRKLGRRRPLLNRVK